MIVAQLFKLRIRGAQIGNSRHNRAFTLVELLVVITIIIILAGLVLATVGYVQKKGARSRTEAEIAAISSACESYKADNGIYPRDASTTDTLDAKAATVDIAKYQAASQYLYGQLASDPNFDGVADTGYKSYMQFKPNQLGTDSNGKLYLRDPFGNSYGYSTIQTATNDATKGYNPTFDLWSIADANPTNNQIQWIRNW
jgi:prepilin-type N-terminal cleavage/methylation domain-containing protein